MNRWMLAASAMLAFTVYVHVFMGGPEVHLPIQQSELSLELRALSAVLWHAVTVILTIFAIAAFFSARRKNADLGIIMIAVQVGFAGLFVYYGLALLGTLWLMPQWIIFLAISVVMGIGVIREKRA